MLRGMKNIQFSLKRKPQFQITKFNQIKKNIKTQNNVKNRMLIIKHYHFKICILHVQQKSLRFSHLYYQQLNKKTRIPKANKNLYKQIIKFNKDKNQFTLHTSTMEVKYINSLQQSKQSILHSIKQLTETVKSNEQKSLAESLSNVLSSIATFDEDFIKGSTSSYSSNLLIQESIDKIIAKIKQSQQYKTVKTQPQQPKLQQPAATLKTVSENVRSSSAQKEPREKSSSAKKDGSSGLFGVFGKILGSKKEDKPKAYQMILPEKQSKAVYDPVKKKWIFEGQEQQPQKQIPKPPPKKQSMKSQSASQQGIPKEIKKTVSQIDDLTAPPSFRRRGQTKSVGGGKRGMIRQEVIPTTLVIECNNPFDSLVNMIDKEFYKLQQELEQLETLWRSEKEKQLKNVSLLGSSRLKESRTVVGLGLKEKVEMSESEKDMVELLNREILEFNQTSSMLLDDYLMIKQADKTSNQQNYEFDVLLNQELMKVARDNTIISHQLVNQSKDKEKLYKQKMEIEAPQQKQEQQKAEIQQTFLQRNPIAVMLFQSQLLSEQALKSQGEIKGLGFDVNLLKQEIFEKDREIIELKYKLSEYEENLGEKGKVALNLSGKYGLIGQLQTTLQALEKNASMLEEGLQKSENQSTSINLDLHTLNQQLKARDQQITELNQLVQRLQNDQQKQVHEEKRQDPIKLETEISPNEDHANHIILKSQLKQKNDLIESLSLQLKQQSLQLEQVNESNKILSEEKIIASQFIEENSKINQEKQKFIEEIAELRKDNQKIRVEILRMQEERKSLQFHTRQQQLIQQETLKSNLQQLEAFAQSVSQQNALLISIQAKQVELQNYRASSDRSSQNSSKKSSISNQNDDLQNSDPRTNSFLNISDILTEMTKQYIEKITEMKYHYNELQQGNKSLYKQLLKERQKVIGEIDCLKKSLTTSQALNEGYKKSRKQLQERISWYETECQKLRKKLQHMKKQEANNRELLEQALYQKHNHNHSLSILQNNNEELEFKIESLEEELQLKSAEVEEVNGQVDRLRVEVEEIDQQLRQRDNVITRMKNKMAHETEHLQNIIHTKDIETKNIIRGRERQLDTARKQIEAMLEKIEKLQRESKSLKDTYNIKLQQVQLGRKDLHKQVKAKQYQINQLTQSIQQKQREIERLKQSSRDFAQKSQEFQSVNHSQRLQIEELRSQLHSIRQENTDQIMVIEEINTEKQNLETHVENIQHQLSSLNQQLESTRNQLSQSYRNIEKTTEYSSQLQKENQSLVSQMQTLTSQLQTYSSNQQYYQQISQTFNFSLQSVKREKAELQNSLEDTMNKYTQVMKDFFDMKQSMDSKIGYLSQELSNSFSAGQQLSHQLSQYSSLVQKMDQKITQLQIELEQNKASQSKANTHELQEKHSQQIAEVLELLDSKEKQLQALTQEYNSLKHQHQRLKHDQMTRSQQLNGWSHLQEQHRQLTANYAQIYKMYQDLQAKCEQNDRRMIEIKQKLTQILQSKLNQKSEKYRETSKDEQFQQNQPNVVINQMIFQLGQIFEQIIQQRSQLQAKSSQLVQNIQNLQQQQQSSQQRIQQLNQELTASQAEVNQLNSKIIDQQTLLINHQSLNATNSKQSLQAQQRVKQLQQTNNELLLMIDTLQQGNQVKISENKQLDKRLQQKYNYIHQLNAQISQLQGQVREKQSQLKAYKAEDDKLPRNQFEDLILQYEDLFKELQQAKEKLGEFQKIKREKQILQEENYQLKEEKANNYGMQHLVDPQAIFTDQNPRNQHNGTHSQTYNASNTQPQPHQPLINKSPSPLEVQIEQLNEIITQLSKRLETTEEQNSIKSAQIDSLNQRLFRQKQLNLSLKEKTDETDLLLESLAQENERKDNVIRQQIDAINAKDAIISELSVSLQAKTEELTRALQQKSKLQSRVQSQRMIQEISNNNKNQLQEREENMREMQELMGSLSEELDEKRAKQMQLMQLISQQEIQISMLKQKNNQLQAQMEEQQRQLNLQQVKDRQEKQISLRQLVELDKKQDGQSEELYMVIEQMQRQLQQKNQQVEQLNNILDNLNLNIKNTPTQPINQPDDQQDAQLSFQATHPSTLSNKQQEEASTKLQERLQKLSQQIIEKNNQIQNQIMYAEILKEKQQQLISRNQMLQKNNHQLQAHINKLEKHLEELQTQVQSIQNQTPKSTEKQTPKQQTENIREELQTLLANMQDQLSIKEEELFKRANEIHRLKQSELQHIDEIQKLKDQNQRHQKAANLLEEVILNNTEQLNSLKTEKETLQHTINQLQEQLIAIKNKSQEAFSRQDNEQIKTLRQQVTKLESAINKERERVTRKQEEIEEMNELINSQASDIENLQEQIKSLDLKLIETAEKYQQKLKTEIQTQQLNTVKQQVTNVQSVLNAITPSSDQQNIDKISALKLQLQETYEQLRNKKIEVDELRQNIFDVNKMFTERENKYEAKIKSLQTEIHKYDKYKDAFVKYENSIKELQLEVSSLTAEKTGFLRVIENLEKQLMSRQKKIGGYEESDNAPTVAKRQPVTDQKLRSTRSEGMEMASEVKPTGFFGSISSLFMTPLQTERMSKNIIKK